MSAISSFYTPSVLNRATTLGQNLRVRDSVSTLQNRINTLTEQQTTGRWATTHGDLRSQSTLVQNLRQKTATLEGYARTLNQVQTRIEAQQGATDIVQQASDALGIYGMAALNTDAEIQLQQVPREAFGAMERIITALNSNIEGRYLFSGADTQTRPVVDLDTILEGKPGKMGLKDAVANRLLADLGGPIDDAGNPPDGRVTVSRAGSQVTVQHDGGDFGLKLQNATFPTGNIQPTAPTTGVVGTPTGSTLSMDFGTLAHGDEVVLTFELPDGQTVDVTMLAVNQRSRAPAEGVVEFEIDDDPAISTANFVNALRGRVTEIARSDLAGASGVAAASDFFDVYPPRVVDGADPVGAPTFDTSGANVVDWYVGARGPADARDAMTAKIDDATWVSYGARANESELRDALKFTALLAAVPYTDDTVDRYHAVTSRAAPGLKATAGDVVDMRSAIGVTQRRLEVTLDRHEDVRYLTEQQALRIEKVDEYEVATELNNLITQLQGTYSITAKVQQLSLVNFL